MPAYNGITFITSPVLKKKKDRYETFLGEL